MIALLAVAVAAVLTGLLALLINLTGWGRARRATPLDTEAEVRWLVAHAPRHTRRVLSVAERRLFGGAALAVALTVVFVTAVSVGWLLDTVDGNRGFARWDRSLAEWGRDNATGNATALLRVVTQLGGTGWLLPLLVAVGLVAYWRRSSWNVLTYLVIVGVGILLLNNGLKLAVGRERPDLGRLVSHRGSSFPSGHTAAAAACWAALALVWSRRRPDRGRPDRGRRDRAVAAALAATVTAGVAASRVLLGVHWLTDVIAGALTGWGWFLFATIVCGGRLLRFGEPVERAARRGPPRRAPLPAGAHERRAGPGRAGSGEQPG